MEADEELYDRVVRGDVRAFDVLYERYETRLFGFIRAMLGDRGEAEEVFHEAFLGTLKRRDVRHDGGSFRTWLYRIARNLALNRIRSRTRGARALAQLPDAERAATADEKLEEHERLRALDEAVARLPPALSDVYHLRSSGLSYEEMAGVLEIPLGTIKSRMNQMVTQLREEMKSWTAR